MKSRLMKRLSAAAAALIATASLAGGCVTASAAPSPSSATPNLTISGVGGESLSGHSFDFYQIGSYSNIELTDATPKTVRSLFVDKVSDSVDQWIGSQAGISQHSKDISFVGELLKASDSDRAVDSAKLGKALGASGAPSATLSKQTTNQGKLSVSLPQGVYLIADSQGHPMIEGTTVDDNGTQLNWENGFSSPLGQVTVKSTDSQLTISHVPFGQTRKTYVKGDPAGDMALTTGMRYTANVTFTTPAIGTANGITATIRFPKYVDIKDATAYYRGDSGQFVSINDAKPVINQTRNADYSGASVTWKPTITQLDNLLSRKIDISVTYKNLTDRPFAGTVAAGAASPDAINCALNIAYYGANNGGTNYTATDNLWTSDIDIKAVDFAQQDQAVAGAQFKMLDLGTNKYIKYVPQFSNDENGTYPFTGYDETDEADAGYVNTGINGITEINNFGTGKYKLVQFVPGNDHILPVPVEFGFDVDQRGNITEDKANSTPSSLIVRLDPSVGEKYALVTIANISSLTELPQTGSKYLKDLALAVVVLAILLVLLAALLSRHKRQNSGQSLGF